MLERLSLTLLAAGQSSRLGQNKCLLACLNTQGEDKALSAHFDVEPWISLKLKQLLAVQAHYQGRLDIELVVVLGFQAQSIKDQLAPLINKLSVLDNEQWQSGMGSSVSLAAAHALNTKSALLIALVDQWQLETRHYISCIDAWRASSKPITHTVNKARSALGPPLVCEFEHLELFLNLPADVGARRVLKQHASLCEQVALDRAFVDLDTENDLKLFRTHFPETH
ncbi:NTP transferase domain-containing protein [Agaribacterium sp. ZY112]|uniref:nucleotidyltransferase family protein n=1 Tax=Agaribacterium sp. ZY112 TaxID=3233574 RepID=UPI0035258DAA